jgi:hypothetical protein
VDRIDNVPPDLLVALKLGKLLLWLEVNVPEISQRTANIYMALAKPDARKVIDEAYSQRAATIGAKETSASGPPSRWLPKHGMATSPSVRRRHEHRRRLIRPV